MSNLNDDVLGAMNDLDAFDKKAAVSDASEDNVDASTLAHVDDVDQAIIIDQEIHSAPVPLVMILPDAVWFVEESAENKIKVSSHSYRATLGLSGTLTTVNFRWPDYENLGLASYAFFKPGDPDFQFFRGWPDYIIFGSLIYWLHDRGDLDASLRVVAPGYSLGSESIPITFNEISIQDRVASNYPCDPFSDNGAPIRILTEILPYEHQPFAVSSGGCLSVAWGQGSFVSLRNHTLNFGKLASLIANEIIGEPFVVSAEACLTADELSELEKLAALSHSRFEITENSISISPGISIQSWMENALINAGE